MDDDQLFQVELKAEPFWMLAACMFVNLTMWTSAKPIFLKVKKRWPTPEAVSQADRDELMRMIRPLGLYGIRSTKLIAMAAHWCDEPPKTAADVMKIYGCGKYAADSWAIFVEGRLDVEPEDLKLRYYLQEAKEKGAEAP